MTVLSIQILGDFQVIYRQKPVAGLHQPRMQAVLGYLLLHRDTILLRQALALRFWPESSEQQAQTNLRQLLHHLRRVLPESERFLQIETRTLSWKPQLPCSLDLDIFESQLAQAAIAERQRDHGAQRRALDAALSIYQGDLLPYCSDDWALSAREHISQRYTQALMQAAQLAGYDGDLNAAISYTQQLIRADPLQESSYLRLMELYSEQGDRASALRVYQECATQLERELGIGPNTQLQAAHTRLTQSQQLSVKAEQKSAVRSWQSALVGRRTELRAIKEAWRQAARGQMSFVLLAGEAGIGKTRLAEELADYVLQQGIAIAHTRAYGMEGHLPSRPLQPGYALMLCVQRGCDLIRSG